MYLQWLHRAPGFETYLPGWFDLHFLAEHDALASRSHGR
jgi:hypothetical protein